MDLLLKLLSGEVRQTPGVLSNKWYVLSRTKLLECCVLVDRFIILGARRVNFPAGLLND